VRILAQTVAALRAVGAEFKHINIFEEAGDA